MEGGFREEVPAQLEEVQGGGRYLEGRVHQVCLAKTSMTS